MTARAALPVAAVWALTIFMWLILGMVIDSTSQLVLTVHFIVPVLTSLGGDPVAQRHQAVCGEGVYEDVTPGPKAYNWNEVVMHLDEFVSNPDWYSEERKTIKDKFHIHQNGMYSENVFAAI